MGTAQEPSQGCARAPPSPICRERDPGECSLDEPGGLAASQHLTTKVGQEEDPAGAKAHPNCSITQAQVQREGCQTHHEHQQQQPWVEGCFLQALYSCDQVGQGFQNSHSSSLPASSPLLPWIGPFLQRTMLPDPSSQAPGMVCTSALAQPPFPAASMRPFEFALPYPSKGVCCMGLERAQHPGWQRGGEAAVPVSKTQLCLKKPRNFKALHTDFSQNQYSFHSSSAALPVPVCSSRDLRGLLPHPSPFPPALALQPAGFPQHPPNPSGCYVYFNPGTCSLKLEEMVLLLLCSSRGICPEQIPLQSP